MSVIVAGRPPPRWEPCLTNRIGDVVIAGGCASWRRPAQIRLSCRRGRVVIPRPPVTLEGWRHEPLYDTLEVYG